MAMSDSNDLNEAMGADPAAETPEPAKKPASRPQKIKATRRGKTGDDNPAAKPRDRAGNVTTLASGDKCPKCDHGYIKVVRTEVKRSKNARVRIWGCGDRKCGLTVRAEATPISISRTREKVKVPQIGSNWWEDDTEI